jgi:hypothetical protein
MPNTAENPQQTNVVSEETARKIAKITTWTIVLAVLLFAVVPKAKNAIVNNASSLLDLFSATKAVATAQAKPPVPTYTLRCGNGTGVVLPGGVRRAAFLVPPGKCDSEYIILPKGYWQMGLYPSGVVEYRNESDKLIGLDSADTEAERNILAGHPRELRIRNLENEPVVVQATFAY